MWNLAIQKRKKTKKKQKLKSSLTFLYKWFKGPLVTRGDVFSQFIQLSENIPSLIKIYSGLIICQVRFFPCILLYTFSMFNQETANLVCPLIVCFELHILVYYMNTYTRNYTWAFIWRLVT